MSLKYTFLSPIQLDLIKQLEQFQKFSAGDAYRLNQDILGLSKSFMQTQNQNSTTAQSALTLSNQLHSAFDSAKALRANAISEAYNSKTITALESMNSAFDTAKALRANAISEVYSSKTITALESMNKAFDGISSITRGLDSFYRQDIITRDLTNQINALQKFSQPNSMFTKYNDLLSPLTASIQPYNNWLTGLNITANDISQPQIAAPIREQFITSHLMSTTLEVTEDAEISEINKETTQEIDNHIGLILPAAIESINPGLFRLWEGAWESFNSNNPDKIRHTLTSARELVTQVLHALAPDDQVKIWTLDNKHYHNGRPTRKARFLFIVSDVSNDDLLDFFDKEIESWISLFDAFQKGTHSVISGFSDLQVRIILRKVHSLICTLMEIRSIN